MRAFFLAVVLVGCGPEAALEPGGVGPVATEEAPLSGVFDAALTVTERGAGCDSARDGAMPLLLLPDGSASLGAIQDCRWTKDGRLLSVLCASPNYSVTWALSASEDGRTLRGSGVTADSSNGTCATIQCQTCERVGYDVVATRR